MNDRGIDLGTSTVVIYNQESGVLLSEPTVVAVDTRQDTVLAVGSAAYEMVGRTPPHITAAWPLEGGVISDYMLTKEVIKKLLGQVGDSRMVKPRVSVCVPASITGVEADAVVDAVVSAGARQVFLIEEPIAAAIGAGIDITRPIGRLVVDIGGGTTDVAVISMGGIVQSASIKIAGNYMDHEIVKYVRDKFRIAIGERMAEKLKREVGCCVGGTPAQESTVAKGRNLLTGLPQSLTITTEDLQGPIMLGVTEIKEAIHGVLERTPPELAGDIYERGITLTGGGALLAGLPEYLSRELKVMVEVSDQAQNCVAIGAGKSFALEGSLESGFRDATPR